MPFLLPFCSVNICWVNRWCPLEKLLQRSQVLSLPYTPPVVETHRAGYVCFQQDSQWGRHIYREIWKKSALLHPPRILMLHKTDAKRWYRSSSPVLWTSPFRTHLLSTYHVLCNFLGMWGSEHILNHPAGGEKACVKMANSDRRIRNPVLSSVMPKSPDELIWAQWACALEKRSEAAARWSFATAMPGVSLRVLHALKMYGMLRQTSAMCWGNANQWNSCDKLGSGQSPKRQLSKNHG